MTDKKPLHITNGDSLTSYLIELGFKDNMLTWREMLCEGPTQPLIDSDSFYQLRKSFLSKTYSVNPKEYTLKQEIALLNNAKSYSEINLWFEYDLFCHINLIAVISLLHQKEIDLPLYFICSGRVAGEDHLKGLAELNSDQLMHHYNNKILLSKDDKDLALTLWRTYCGKDHNIFKPYIVKKSNFKYLSNCLKAHLLRFPDQKTGLGKIEENILKLINEKEIKSKNHLLGYILNYQGYYGYGDIQLLRIIDKLTIFFDITKDRLRLNRNGHNALLGEYNMAKSINNTIAFGGVDRLSFQFNRAKNKLIKTVGEVD